MVYKGNDIIKSIYKGDQFILGVFKGTSQVYPQIGGINHVGSFTAYNVNVMSSPSGRVFSYNGWNFPIIAAAMSDKLASPGGNYLMTNPPNYPISFYNSSPFSCRIYRAFRIYTPFAVGVLPVGHARAGTNTVTSGYIAAFQNVSLSLGYNYITQVMDFNTETAMPYLFPIAFGAWSSNWIVDHMSVQVIPM